MLRGEIFVGLAQLLGEIFLRIMSVNLIRFSPRYLGSSEV
jgi:hypothetical protein